MIEIVYYRDPALNFGDDLNAWIWDAVLPERVKASDKLVLVGIGSILTQERLGAYAGSARQVVVLGSGTSYGVPPADMSGWLIKAVRGPMTAAVVGEPQASVTDGAALLAAAPQLIGETQVRDKVLFMPHHRSLRGSRWAQAAALAGLEFVSPQETVPAILAKFARARLVVAEAMHGAIVADTLRIPWIPVAASPAVDEFKWRDWTRSLDLPFEPQLLAPSSAKERVRYRRLAGKLDTAGLGGFRTLARTEDRAALGDYLTARFAQGTPVSSRAERFFDRLAGGALKVVDQAILERSAASLRAASETPAFLSDAPIFRARLDRLLEGVASLERLA
jgi:hypothetical protein